MAKADLSLRQRTYLTLGVTPLPVETPRARILKLAHKAQDARRQFGRARPRIGRY